MVQCNNGCVFCRFLACVPIETVKQIKSVADVHVNVYFHWKGSSGKKGHAFYVTSFIYCFSIWTFSVFTVFIFSTIKTLRMPTLKKSKCCNFTPKIYFINCLFFSKLRKNSEILTLNPLNFTPNSSGVAVDKSRKGWFFTHEIFLNWGECFKSYLFGDFLWKRFLNPKLLKKPGSVPRLLSYKLY